ncbi:MAG: tail fiber domain-containing protein, partial [Thermoplasmata archaeon]
ASGTSALYSNTTGYANTASGGGALYSNTTGYNNTASGYDALQHNTTGGFNTALGYLAGSDQSSPSLTNSTAIGAFADVTQSNSLVLGSINGVNGATASTNVGIGTTAPQYTLDVSGTGNFTGLVKFASGQTFPGAGTITGVTAGTDLTGGGSSGNVTLNVDTTKVVTGVTAGTDLTGGGTGGVLTLNIDITKVPQLNYANTFTGNQTVNGNLSATGLVTGSSFGIGSNLFAFGSYAKYNAFLGFAGNTTTTGSWNTGSGFQALEYNSSGASNTATGEGALEYNTSGSYNTASGAAALFVNTEGSYNTASGYGTLLINAGNYNTASGYEALQANDTGWYNTASGYYALTSNGNASSNTADGAYALSSNDSGNYNTASGYGALDENISGDENTAVGAFSCEGYQTGNDLTCIGYESGPSGDGLSNATAIGAHAVVGASNALVLGGTGKYAVKVGIGTATPSNVLTIAQGAGQPLSDGWATFSSRRWKTNIHTLHDALAKVEQLRGVSYDLKANGQHEVGVIAEEVGAVVPEVVTWEKNGKDAQSVDYGRLTALLIEATKEQQALIREQKEQIRAQQAQIVRLTRQVKTIQATLKANGRSGSAVRTVKAEGTTVRQ